MGSVGRRLESSQDMEGLRHHVVQLECCGPVSVYVQGDLDKLRDSVVFLTVHDVGASYETWVKFVNEEAMEGIKRRCLFLHLALPGQEIGSKDLEGSFPSMEQLGLGLVTILDQLRIRTVVGLGNGAGANIITRFGMYHPTRVHGLLTVNNTATASRGRFMERLAERMRMGKKDDFGGSLNSRNVASFAESYKKRKDILTELNKKIRCEVLLVTGMKSRYVADTEVIHKEMEPGSCSMIKVDDVVEPLLESTEKVAEALALFCQGLGLLSSLARRVSSGQGTLTMEERDQPNLRRLSLATA